MPVGCPKLLPVENVWVTRELGSGFQAFGVAADVRLSQAEGRDCFACRESCQPVIFLVSGSPSENYLADHAMDRQQISQRRATTPDLFVEQAIADRVEASAAAFNRNERAQIAVSRQLRNRLWWGSFFPVPTIGVRNNLSIDEGPKGGLIFLLLRGQFNSHIGTYRELSFLRFRGSDVI